MCRYKLQFSEVTDGAQLNFMLNDLLMKGYGDVLLAMTSGQSPLPPDCHHHQADVSRDTQTVLYAFR